MRYFLPLLFLLSACVAAAGYREPIAQSALRATPLNFGLFVTTDPDRNPINPPEKFSGYHVGTDFEVTADEVDTEVPIFAICTGTVAYGGFAQGYGGLLVERCTLDGESVTVLYGHLVREGLPAVDSTLVIGQKIGVLAPPRSVDSDGNRKHLHLGIHRGDALDERGYVQSEKEMNEFIDPASVLPYRLSGTEGKLIPYWKK